MSSDEKVSSFIAFTGTSDPSIASQYLEMSGGNLETAVGLYLEHQGGGGSSSGPSSSGNNNSFGGGEDTVRAPDATQTMRLMDDGPGMMGLMGNQNPYMGIMGSMMHEQQFSTSAFARDVVNSAAADDDDEMDEAEDDDYSIENDTDDDDDGAGSSDENAGSGERRRRRRRGSSSAGRNSTGPRGPSGLADMFAPPSHLICNAGGFDGARTNAKDSKRWLLVNIQRDNEFSCHALNRDVWRDELVENLIGEGFIFWQVMDTTPEGRLYVSRYNVFDYPHVAIIDPRTGRLMWKKEGWTQQNPLTAEQFAESAMDFCSRHSFDKPPQAPRPPSSRTSNGPPTKKPMHEMSEEEQLKAAMRASLADVGVGDEYEMEDDDDDDDLVVLDSSDEEVEESKPKALESKEPATATEDSTPPLSLLDELVSFDIGDEPGSGARIQIRMPSGKRQVRRFDPSHSVKHVYAFVAQFNKSDGQDGKEFVLKAGFPPKDLIADIDNSIQSCSLAGEAITVRWK